MRRSNRLWRSLRSPKNSPRGACLTFWRTMYEPKTADKNKCFNDLSKFCDSYLGGGGPHGPPTDFQGGHKMTTIVKWDKMSFGIHKKQWGCLTNLAQMSLETLYCIDLQFRSVTYTVCGHLCVWHLTYMNFIAKHGICKQMLDTFNMSYLSPTYRWSKWVSYQLSSRQH